MPLQQHLSLNDRHIFLITKYLELSFRNYHCVNLDIDEMSSLFSKECKCQPMVNNSISLLYQFILALMK